MLVCPLLLLFYGSTIFRYVIVTFDYSFISSIAIIVSLAAHIKGGICLFTRGEQVHVRGEGCHTFTFMARDYLHKFRLSIWG
jgi:hypothetical protein